MKIGEHGLIEHLKLLVPLLGLVAAVWVIRIVLDVTGFPPRFVRAISVTGAASLAILLAATLIHVRRFGSYPSVVVASLALVIWGQLLIVVAIAFSVISGWENVFTAPEFSIPGDDPFHFRHILGHLTFGVGAGTLYGAATGCLLLWFLRRFVPMRPAA